MTRKVFFRSQTNRKPLGQLQMPDSIQGMFSLRSCLFEFSRLAGIYPDNKRMADGGVIMLRYFKLLTVMRQVI